MFSLCCTSSFIFSVSFAVATFLSFFVFPSFFHCHIFHWNQWTLQCNWRYCYILLKKNPLKQTQNSPPTNSSHVTLIFLTVMNVCFSNSLLQTCWGGGEEKKKKALVDVPSSFSSKVKATMFLIDLPLEDKWDHPKLCGLEINVHKARKMGNVIKQIVCTVSELQKK